MCTYTLRCIVFAIVIGFPFIGLAQSNVGIGTASPSQKLDISGNIKSHKFLDRDDVNYLLDPSNSTLAGTFNGKVGIGTINPTGQLEVQGINNDMIRRRSSDDWYVNEWQDENGNPLWHQGVHGTSYDNMYYVYDKSINDYRLRIEQNGSLNLLNGNVGIGTTSPSKQLHVSGDIYIPHDNEVGAGSGTAVKMAAIRGVNTNEQLEVYNRVSIGDPNGWGSFMQAPDKGLSVWGSANFGNDNDGDYLTIDSDGKLIDAGGDVEIDDHVHLTDGHKLVSDNMDSNEDLVYLKPSGSSQYPTFLRSRNATGQASPWLYQEDDRRWGLWHDNNDNDLHFTSSQNTNALESNVGGVNDAHSHMIYSFEQGNLEVGGDLTVSGGLDIGDNVNMNNNKIVNLAYPSNNQDAASKKYVDDQVGGNDDWTKSGSDIYNNNSGNVGIGTTSPTAGSSITSSEGDAITPMMHIYSNTNNVHPTLHVSAENNDEAILMLSENSSSNGYGAKVYYEGSGTNFFNIAVGDGGTWTDRLTIDRNGLMGVNTTSPQNIFDINVRNSYTSGVSFDGREALTAEDGDNWLRLNQDNDFSSGVYSPNKIRGDGGMYVNDDEGWQYQSEDVISPVDDDIDMQGRDIDEVENISYSGSGSWDMEIRGSNNFWGVWDDTDGRIFKVNRGGEVDVLQDVLDMNNNKIVNLAYPSNNQDAASKKYVDDQVGGNDDWTKSGSDIYNNNSGNVGIGTSNPDQKLTISGGNIRVGDNGQNSNKLYFSGGTSDKSKFIATKNYWLTLGAHSNEGIRIEDDNGNIEHQFGLGSDESYLNNGNVGIGTTSPSKQLHVSGDIYIPHDNKFGAGSGTAVKMAGIRGQNTNQQLELYNRVSIGDPNGWGSFVQAPDGGLSVWGKSNFGNDSDGDYLTIDSDGMLTDAGGDVEVDDDLHLTDGHRLVSDNMDSNEDLVWLKASSSSQYPTFLRSENPSGETSPWIYQESNRNWGIWHDNPDNDLHFTSSTSSDAIESGVGGVSGAYSHMIYSFDEGNLTVGGELDIQNNKIVNLAYPSSNQDAASKKYVDDQVGGNDDWTKSGSDIYNNNSGNVGIGTNGPSGQLEVQGINNDMIRRRTNDDWFVNEWQNSSGTPLWHQGVHGTSYNNRYYIYDKTVSKYRLQINQGGSMNLLNGKVGIGTTSPAKMLQVGATGNHGKMKIQGNDAHLVVGDDDTNSEPYVEIGETENTWGVRMQWDHGTEMDFWGLHSGNKDRIMSLDAGNQRVGIGTAGPDQELHVAGSWPQMLVEQNDGTADASVQFNAGSSYNRWNIGPGAGGAEGEEFGISIYDDSDNLVRTNMIVEETGEVGIGVDDPASKLSIGSIGSSEKKAWIKSTNTSDKTTGLFVEQDGDPGFADDSYGILATVNDAVTNNGGGYYRAIRGNAVASSAQSDGRAYGIYGAAGNATNGTNYGAYGYLKGSNDGAGVFGTTSGDDLSVGAQYAGYFKGDLAYTGSIYDVSDQRLKKNIKPYQSALAQLDSLKAYTYSFKENNYGLDEGKQYGLIAQEVEKVFPEMVQDMIHSKDGGQTYKGINRMQLLPVMLQAIKEQQSTIEEYKAKVKKLQKQNASLKSEVEAIKEHVGMQENQEKGQVSK